MLRASDLRVEDEPEQTKELDVALPVTIVTKRKVFYRDGKKIGAIIDWTQKVQGVPPEHNRILQFFVGPDAWVEANLEGPRSVVTKSAEPILVFAADDAITVHAPDAGYYEMFFLKGDQKFLDGKSRDSVIRDALPHDYKRAQPR